MKIGFIGLGHMGYPMAVNLIKAGYEVYGYDLSDAARNRLEEAGGKGCSSLKEVVNGKDAVITMLQTGEQVKQVCLGDEGLFAIANQGSLYIDCSSIDVDSSRQVHAGAEAKGIKVIDAPVSGGVGGAEAATLTFMVGGTKEAYQMAEPLLQKMGKAVIHTGAAGSGQAAKICNNMILGISMVAVSEAFVLAENLGLSPEKLFEVVNQSSGQCWAMSTYPPYPNLLDNVPSSRDYQPGFTAQMMLKDLNLSQNAAKSVKVKTPMAEKAQGMYQQFVEQDFGQLDFSAIIKVLQGLARSDK